MVRNRRRKRRRRSREEEEQGGGGGGGGGYVQPTHTQYRRRGLIVSGVDTPSICGVTPSPFGGHRGVDTHIDVEEVKLPGRRPIHPRLSCSPVASHWSQQSFFFLVKKNKQTHILSNFLYVCVLPVSLLSFLSDLFYPFVIE